MADAIVGCALLASLAILFFYVRHEARQYWQNRGGENDSDPRS